MMLNCSLRYYLLSVITSFRGLFKIGGVICFSSPDPRYLHAPIRIVSPQITISYRSQGCNKITASQTQCLFAMNGFRDENML